MPSQFLLKKKVKHRTKKIINGVEMYRCVKCRRYKFNEDYHTHTKLKGKFFVLNGHKMSICIECYKKLKLKRKIYAKTHNPNYIRYIQYSTECIKIRKKLNINYEQFMLIKNKLIILTKDEKIALVKRILKNIVDSMNNKRNTCLKNKINLIIGYDIEKNYSRFLSFLETKLPEKSGMNLKNYGKMWYVDYELPTKPLKTLKQQKEHFNYKNIIIKTIENLY